MEKSSTVLSKQRLLVVVGSFVSFFIPLACSSPEATCQGDDCDLVGKTDAGPTCPDGQTCQPEPVCGNGEIEGKEQCDDGNKQRYDGCSPSCELELYYRAYTMQLQQSPAASFCQRPNSALGDALNGAFILAASNKGRQDNIDKGIANSLLEIVGLEDLTGQGSGEIGLGRGLGILDTQTGPWPTDGSNPLDWPFVLEEESLSDEGGFADRIRGASLSDGAFIGGLGESLRSVPEFVGMSMRGHFGPETSRPSGVESLAEGLMVAEEVIADGTDEGVCGSLTVAFVSQLGADESVADCLECPGSSHTYVPCESAKVDETCNSTLDTLVGGCVIGDSCEEATVILIPTQPDVVTEGAAPLAGDPDNLHKVPVAQTEGNLDGYSSYFKFRARRIRITGP